MVFKSGNCCQTEKPRRKKIKEMEEGRWSKTGKANNEVQMWKKWSAQQSMKAKKPF